MDNNFGIGFRGEDVTILLQFGTQTVMIFDNAVMHHGDIFVADVRMGVTGARLAVRCPTGMGNAQIAIYGIGIDQVFQPLDLAQLALAEYLPVVDHGYPGGIVATIFQTL